MSGARVLPPMVQRDVVLLFGLADAPAPVRAAVGAELLYALGLRRRPDVPLEDLGLS